MQIWSWFMKIGCKYEVVAIRVLLKNNTKLWAWSTVHHSYLRKWTLHLADTERQLFAPSLFPLLYQLLCQFQIPSTLELMTLAQDDEQILEPDSSPLVVEHPSFPARTSVDWLKQHGLKGTSLWKLAVFLQFPLFTIPSKNFKHCFDHLYSLNWYVATIIRCRKASPNIMLVNCEASINFASLLWAIKSPLISQKQLELLPWDQKLIFSSIHFSKMVK